MELSFASEVPGVRNKTALGLLSSRYLELSFASEVPGVRNNSKCFLYLHSPKSAIPTKGNEYSLMGNRHHSSSPCLSFLMFALIKVGKIVSETTWFDSINPGLPGCHSVSRD